MIDFDNSKTKWPIHSAGLCQIKQPIHLEGVSPTTPLLQLYVYFIVPFKNSSYVL